jgi:hypothetical protein
MAPKSAVATPKIAVATIGEYGYRDDWPSSQTPGDSGMIRCNSFNIADGFCVHLIGVVIRT